MAFCMSVLLCSFYEDSSSQHMCRHTQTQFHSFVHHHHTSNVTGVCGPKQRSQEAWPPDVSYYLSAVTRPSRSLGCSRLRIKTGGQKLPDLLAAHFHCCLYKIHRDAAGNPHMVLEEKPRPTRYDTADSRLVLVDPGRENPDACSKPMKPRPQKSIGPQN